MLENNASYNFLMVCNYFLYWYVWFSGNFGLFSVKWMYLIIEFKNLHLVSATAGLWFTVNRWKLEKLKCHVSSIFPYLLVRLHGSIEWYKFLFYFICLLPHQEPACPVEVSKSGSQLICTFKPRTHVWLYMHLKACMNMNLFSLLLTTLLIRM